MIILTKLVTKPPALLMRNLGIGNNGLVQKWIDNEVAKFLRKYVSKKDGDQEGSVQSAKPGFVEIGVPYAHYQAYSPKISKRNGVRGTHPFERMKADKKDVIKRGAAAYARRISK